MANKLRLSLEEKDALEKIAALSLYDKKIVENVFISLLKVISLELFKDENTIYIPYIGALTISYKDKIISGEGIDVVVNLQVEASESLQQEVKQFSEGEILPTQDYMRLKISENIMKRVDD
jgi:hypothetical protein